MHFHLALVREVLKGVEALLGHLLVMGRGLAGPAQVHGEALERALAGLGDRERGRLRRFTDSGVQIAALSILLFILVVRARAAIASLLLLVLLVMVASEVLK